MNIDDQLREDIERTVERLLHEDVGSGDLTASLIEADRRVSATIETREAMTLAGAPWVDALYRRLDPDVSLRWHVCDGQAVAKADRLCELSGPARAILSGERAALNLLQTLSATATETARFVAAVAGTSCRILDTRKTVPGLRLAQKYAVRCGGGTNHRVGLFDAILIKENHIASAGGIEPAVHAARRLHANVPIQVEVENLAELREALSIGVERILLDNFSPQRLREAVRTNRELGRSAALEASGNVSLDTVRAVAETGVDFVSIGALTKNVRAIDLSMRFAAAPLG